jgi:hypothetical protein
MDYDYKFENYTKLYSFDLKYIIKLLRNHKMSPHDINLKEVIYYYHMKTLRSKKSYNLLDFVHDLYELKEYDLIDDVIQIDHKFSSNDNIYDALLAFEIYKDKTSYINTDRLKLLLSFPPKNYNWNIFYKEFLYNVSESEYDDYIPEIYITLKENNIIEVSQYIIEYWDNNKYFLFENNLSKIEYIDKIIHNQ